MGLREHGMILESSHEPEEEYPEDASEAQAEDNHNPMFQLTLASALLP
jgi:hypothetical protein